MFVTIRISSVARSLHKTQSAFLGKLLPNSGFQIQGQELLKPNFSLRIGCINSTTTFKTTARLDTTAETPKLSKTQARKLLELLLKMQIYPATGDSVSPFMREKYEKEARKYWDLFYKRNENRFFKDRHYLQKEWGHLLGPSAADASVQDNPEVNSQDTPESYTKNNPECNNGDRLTTSKSSEAVDNNCHIVAGTSTASDKQEAAFHKRVVLEVGCGAGNTVYPLLEENPTAFVYACDFSPRAVDLVEAHPSYDAQRVRAFVADITQDDLIREVPAGSVDIVSMIFVLSAISPEKMPAALHNIASVLKPGGHVLVRDYAEGDLAQERLTGKIQKLGENFYVRGDGTRAYYFSEKALLALFADAGLECTDVRMHEREFENRARKIVMNRRWIQGTFRKVAGAVGSALSSCKPLIDGLSKQLAGSTIQDAEEWRNTNDKSCGLSKNLIIRSDPLANSDVGLVNDRRAENRQTDGVNALMETAEKDDVNAPLSTTKEKDVNALEKIGEGDGVNALEEIGNGNNANAPGEKGEGHGMNALSEDSVNRLSGDGVDPLNGDGVHAPSGDGVNTPSGDGVNTPSGDGVHAPGEDGPPSLGELFSAPLEYELRELVVAGKTVRYKALASEHQHTQSSTGLLLWESARVLAAYLSERPHILAGRRVLEVGCGGIALPSTLFAAVTARTTATDGDVAAMALLRANVALDADTSDLSNLRTERLRWGDQEDIARVRSLGGPHGYDVIIGADVVYVKEAVPLLFQTAAALLADEADAAASEADVMLTPPLLLLCHVIRRVAEGDILEAAKRAGFDYHAVIELGELGEGANGAIRLLALRRTNGAR